MPEKSFMDFLNQLDEKSWSIISRQIDQLLRLNKDDPKLSDFSKRVAQCDAIIITTVLKEYNKWANNK